MSLMQQFMECVNYRVTEGSTFQWNCWGPHAYRLDSWNGRSDDGHTITIVFDTKDQTTYSLEAFDYAHDRAYRWLAPSHRQAYFDEAGTRRVDANEAYEDVSFVDLDSLDDFWVKAHAIVAGEDYDTRVTMPIDLPDDQLFELMKLAHDQDITLNQLVERILRDAIEQHENNLA